MSGGPRASEDQSCHLIPLAGHHPVHPERSQGGAFSGKPPYPALSLSVAPQHCSSYSLLGPIWPRYCAQGSLSIPEHSQPAPMMPWDTPLCTKAFSLGAHRLFTHENSEMHSPAAEL